MFQQDWILRQIEMIGVILARLLFGKDKPDYEIVEKEKLSDSDQLYIELIRMLDEGKINEAENRLYEELDPARLPMLELALAFYSRLNQFDDAYLEARQLFFPAGDRRGPARRDKALRDSAGIKPFHGRGSLQAKERPILSVRVGIPSQPDTSFFREGNR